MIQIKSWLNDIVEKCRAYHPNHIFKYDSPKQVPILMIDEKMLEVVVLNIIDNACKFSEPQSIIQISVFMQKNKVGISIKDSGIGIAPDHHKKVFEEYMKIQFHPNKSGYGLGLSFVKKVMELYGGEIQLISDLGKGSEFIAWFPETSIEQTTNLHRSH